MADVMTKVRPLGESRPTKKPKWLTDQWIAHCKTDEVIRSRRWIPQVGDWYVCKRLEDVRKIVAVADYYNHHDRCDIYIPQPSKVRKWRRKK